MTQPDKVLTAPELVHEAQGYEADEHEARDHPTRHQPLAPQTRPVSAQCQVCGQRERAGYMFSERGS